MKALQPGRTVAELVLVGTEGSARGHPDAGTPDRVHSPTLGINEPAHLRPAADLWTGGQACGSDGPGRTYADNARGANETLTMPGPTCVPTTAPTSPMITC